MIRSLCLAAAISFTATPALAESRAEQIGSCMIRHSTENDVDQMKQLMLLALQEKKNEATTVMASLMLKAGLSATGNCGVGYNEIGTPMFEYAVRMYGEHLGTVVMERSLEFMDLPMR
ncbi:MULTISPECIES: hypothetical protein [unclassified Hyphomonas]|mgnify:CR=1 FL=1|jgi:hypothetical protein|uniref:hypothetical protein n=1 Tax=unclassified Hyphomonas TaxID=2630699 RepID=UPI000458BE57|nr:MULTISPECIES: hypothetical protein [unclassified Hyphomonas]KCZ47883.1 hypothetical protein HY17_05230 [Hyphomonas sp. CY54-11-8]RAN41166.1 hypothetical protein HY26_09840 [Hyphomonas sp. GM-8P]